MTLKIPKIISEFNKKDEIGVKNKEITNRIRWITYNKKSILYINYSNFLNIDETINTIINVNDFVKKLRKYDLLILVDVRKSYADEKIIVQALKNRFGEIGTKKNPGRLYNIRGNIPKGSLGHIWSAFAVVVSYYDIKYNELK